MGIPTAILAVGCAHAIAARRPRPETVLAHDPLAHKIAARFPGRPVQDQGAARMIEDYYDFPTGSDS